MRQWQLRPRWRQRGCGPCVGRECCGQQKGDDLLDFSFVPAFNNFPNLSTGYLNAAYKFISHVDGTVEGLCEYDPYGFFCDSFSPFMQERAYQTPNANSLRTGDFQPHKHRPYGLPEFLY